MTERNLSDTFLLVTVICAPHPGPSNECGICTASHTVLRTRGPCYSLPFAIKRVTGSLKRPGTQQASMD